MLLTVLFGELLAILILLSIIQMVKIKWIHLLLYAIALLSFAGVSYYALYPTKFQVTSSWPFIEKVHTVKADLDDQKPQMTSSEFKENESDYDYVSFGELQANNDFYHGKLISQWGRITKVVANDSVGRKLIIDLDESQNANLVSVNYHLSDIEKGSANLKENDMIKVYGEVVAENNSDHVPEINAHFLKLQ